AHAQNMILVHRDGWPERIALRDFHESVEFVRGFLREPERAPNFAALHPRFECAPADRYYAMSSVEELRELFMDTVFVFNLTEVAHLLQRHYAFAEERFWALVRELLTDYSSSWGDADRERELGHRAALVRTESLFRGRLQEPEAGGHHHWIPNALRGPSGRTRHA
ncbi:MAG TPA: IucA/IucC family C-terminal-domain containing protein, partial [Polyangiaceae bacterium]